MGFDKEDLERKRIQDWISEIDEMGPGVPMILSPKSVIDYAKEYIEAIDTNADEETTENAFEMFRCYWVNTYLRDKPSDGNWVTEAHRLLERV